MITKPRCFFAGLLPTTLRNHLAAELARVGLTAQLGTALFPQVNWHQSLSNRFEDDDGLIARLLNLGALISTARAPRLTMDRVEQMDGAQSPWAFKPERTPADFHRLLGCIKAAVATLDRRKQDDHTAHITVSYWPPHALRCMVPITPVEWILNEVQLVRGGGDPYRYEVLGRWTLRPCADKEDGEQLGLF